MEARLAAKPKKSKPARTPPLPPARLAPRLDFVWLRFLIASGFSDAHVLRLLANDDLPTLSDVELSALRAEVVPPKGFAPLDPEHGPSTTFMVANGITPFFRNTDVAVEALRILRSSRPREMVEAAILCAVPRAIVVRLLARHVRCEASEDGVALFEEAFFNVGSVSRSLLRPLVRARVELHLDRSIPREDPRARRRAVSADARSVASSMPSASATWHAVTMSLGWLPRKQDLEIALGEIEQVAIVRASETLMQGRPEAERRALALVAVVEKTRAIRAVLEPPEKGLADALAAHIMRDERRLPTLGDLVAQGDQVGTIDAGPAATVTTAAETSESEDAAEE